MGRAFDLALRLGRKLFVIKGLQGEAQASQKWNIF
jgi:hypothetical protein